MGEPFPQFLSLSAKLTDVGCCITLGPWTLHWHRSANVILGKTDVFPKYEKVENNLHFLFILSHSYICLHKQNMLLNVLVEEKRPLIFKVVVNNECAVQRHRSDRRIHLQYSCSLMEHKN